MRRPRKDSKTPGARQRIIDTLWTLLEYREFENLTVSALATQARCNRGTFYYHFADMEDLLSCAIEQELLGPEGIPAKLFSLITGIDATIADLYSDDQAHKLQLIVTKCNNRGIVERKIEAIVYRMWRAVLCPDGSELAEDTEIIIGYSMSGLLSILTHHINDGSMPSQCASVSPYVIQFHQETIQLTLKWISELQDMQIDEILLRLKMFNQIMDLTKS